MKTLLVIVVLIILAIGGFYLIKNRSKPIIDYSIPTSNPITDVIVSSPTSNSKVSSPLKITGTVPTGWMFEGVMPIKLLDENRRTIATGHGKEKTPGSWQSGNPVAFEGELIFTTTSKNGFIVIEKDNPSGLPENSASFEVAVKF